MRASFSGAGPAIVTSDKPRTVQGSARDCAAQRRVALGIVAVQAGVALAVAALALLWAGPFLARSALVGGLIGVLPSFYLAQRVFRVADDALPGERLRAMYVGSGMKIALSVALFVIAIIALDVHFGAVLATYAATASVYWFALLLPGRGR